MKEKSCLNCNNIFLAKDNRQKFCSRNCAAIINNKIRPSLKGKKRGNSTTNFVNKNNELCEYGCGNIALFKVTKKQKLCCSSNYLSCDEIRRKNSEGGKNAYKNGRTNYFLSEKAKENRAWSRGKTAYTDPRVGQKNRGIEFFTEKSPYKRHYIKNLILKNNLKELKCEKCNLSEWLEEPIKLELHHVNGIQNDNTFENLQLLCPNCHSFTENFRGKNIKSKICKKVSDEDFIEALQTTSNIRQALTKVGLTPKGANYTRARELLDKIAA